MTSNRYNLQEASPRELLAMYEHLKEEMAELRKDLYAALPKGSPERHIMEHELMEKARLDAQDRKAELLSHALKTAIAALVLIIGSWVYQGGIATISKDMSTPAVEQK